MKNNIFIFPGQGSQKLGMGRDLYEQDLETREYFKRAEEIINRPLVDVVFGDNPRVIDKTINTQPAVYLVDYLLYRYLQKNGLEPIAVAGHSLGELVALTAAGVIDFEKGIYLVGKRAEFMEDAAREKPGSMLAVIGLSLKQIDGLCGEVEGLEVANYNSPGQVVLSGTEDVINSAEVKLKSMGAKLIVKLAVSGGFHSSLMEEAGEKFWVELSGIEFSKPRIDLAQNYSGNIETDVEVIKKNLARQISSPVRWIDCCQSLYQKLKVKYWIEVGPGNVLTKLVKRILKDIDIYTANSLKSSENIIKLLRN